jgi:hypothetical protein
MRNLTFKINIPKNYEKVAIPFLNEWTGALESGQYKQGTGLLCESLVKGGDEYSKYCCLGVLCKIKGTLKGSSFDFSVLGDEGAYFSILSPNNPCTKYIGRSGAFPEGVFVDVELVENKLPHRCNSLTSCNDAGLSFKQIVEIIKTIWKEEQ